MFSLWPVPEYSFTDTFSSFCPEPSDLEREPPATYHMFVQALEPVDAANLLGPRWETCPAAESRVCLIHSDICDLLCGLSLSLSLSLSFWMVLKGNRKKTTHEPPLISDKP